MSSGAPSLGRVRELRRFPVKSLLGETLASVRVTDRGLEGDRLWAVRTPDGKLASGKTTRRFRQVEGLFRLRARYEGSVPIVTLPDGTEYRGGGDASDAALSLLLGFDAALVREASVSHFDEGPVSLITTASLRALGHQMGEAVDRRRFRANVLIDVDADSEGHVEDAWAGRRIRLGQCVLLRVIAPLTRCVMVDNAQEDLPQDFRVLRALGRYHGATFGVWAKVEVGGEVRVGDEVAVQGPAAAPAHQL